MEIQEARLKLQDWHDQGIIVDVIATALGQGAAGEAGERHWSESERVGRALKIFSVLFLVAAASLAIPIVHFVLAPLLFLICIVATIKIYRQRMQILGGIALCPVCKHEFVIISGYSQWPIYSNCTNCNRTLTIAKHKE